MKKYCQFINESDDLSSKLKDRVTDILSGISDIGFDTQWSSPTWVSDRFHPIKFNFERRDITSSVCTNIFYKIKMFYNGDKLNYESDKYNKDVINLDDISESIKELKSAISQLSQIGTTDYNMLICNNEDENGENSWLEITFEIFLIIKG